ncbi:hypothetical protein EVAR_87890_1 [Eumeta japonica]|uniref:Uncharacterized protein n=1 Tax=Eumeta variegata TaxID=151549 RepID=A0A4C1WXI3_EUMVA|nr:hypothetical protein EVAR_87890_1 [Eumeta japonica]
MGGESLLLFNSHLIDFYKLSTSTVRSSGGSNWTLRGLLQNDAKEVARMIRLKLLMDSDGYSLYQRNSLMRPSCGCTSYKLQRNWAAVWHVIRRPVSALNGRATAPVNARCTAIPACGSRQCACASYSARVCVLRPTAPRPACAPFYFVFTTTRPARRLSSRRTICSAAGVFDIGRTLLRPPQWISRNFKRSNGRGHLDLLRGSGILLFPGLPDLR